MSMDADLWSARIFAAKRHHVIQSANHQWEYLNIDDFEGEDDIRPEFACPYCYEELEIAALCVHLEEHTFESKGVSCPVCALKVSKDIVGHITLHHGHLFKIQRRRRFRRPSGSTFSLFSKEYRETHLQSLLGGSGFTNNSNTFTSLNSASDTLLDLLDSSKQGHCSSETKAIPTLNHKPSLEGNLSMEERERKLKDEMRRTTFVQQLVVSAMLGEII